MASARLGKRFSALLAERGSATRTEDALRAAEVARLLLQHGMLVHAFQRHLDLAPLLVARLSQLPLEEAELLVGLATDPEHRPLSGDNELAAFSARFGRTAATLLVAQDAQEVDLARFSLERGPVAAVFLLDAMYELASVDDGLNVDELRRLDAAAEELGVDVALACRLHRTHTSSALAHGQPVLLDGNHLRIGRGAGSDLLLPDPLIAPHHADLIKGEDGWRIVDARSGRATVLNGRPVRSAPFGPDDELRLGPYELHLSRDGFSLRAETTSHMHALSVHGLSRRIGETVLLDDVGFTVLSGEVVAVVGPSGAGKTTLLNAITGVAPAERGEVLLDEKPFHEILAIDRARVGSVPQDDIIHPELTVEESLYYGARLRLPRADAATSRTQVDRVLRELGIDHIRHSRIGDAVHRGISGGQRKRANLGQELLSRRTSILFLDEPTSGLDPRAAQDIVRLVRQLADHGRMVFLVTHDLSPQVMAQVDHLMVLVPGGRLAWFGPPDAACRYFGVDTPDAIFNRLGDRPPEEWSRAFRASPAWRRFVSSRKALPALEEAERARGIELDEPSVAVPTVTDPVRARVGPLRQLEILVRRYARVKARDRTGLWVLGAQPPFLALVMGTVFPRPTAPMLFMLTLSCLWFGMSAAVRELITDRAIWRRERRVGVGVFPYVGSKVLVLGLLSVAQCAFLSTALWQLFGLGGMGYSALSLAAVCSLVGLCGMSLGLLVSAVFDSSEAAVGSLPLLLIPQISFSTLLVNLRAMTPLSRIDQQRRPAALRLRGHAQGRQADRHTRPRAGQVAHLDVHRALVRLRLQRRLRRRPGAAHARLAGYTGRLLHLVPARCDGQHLAAGTIGTHALQQALGFPVPDRCTASPRAPRRSLEPCSPRPSLHPWSPLAFSPGWRAPSGTSCTTAAPSASTRSPWRSPPWSPPLPASRRRPSAHPWR